MNQRRRERRFHLCLQQFIDIQQQQSIASSLQIPPFSCLRIQHRQISALRSRNPIMYGSKVLAILETTMEMLQVHLLGGCLRKTQFETLVAAATLPLHRLPIMLPGMRRRLTIGQILLR